MLRVLLQVMVALALSVAAGACSFIDGSASIPVGKAMPAGDAEQLGAVPVRPGAELGFLFAYLVNKSSSAVTLKSVSITGRGVGSIVKPVSIEIAPLRDGYHRYVMSAVPAAIYTTDPPVYFLKNFGGCHKQPLFRVKGFRMSPGTQVRIFVVLRAVKPGAYKIGHHVVFYSQTGMLYQDPVPAGMHGEVSRTAQIIPADPDESRCVRPTGSRELPGHGRP